MSETIIRRIGEPDDAVKAFIHESFSGYGEQRGVALNYEDFCFTANRGGEILGAITGRAYYNEVHITDLIIAEGCRGRGLGSRLVKTVEDAFRGGAYDVVTLTTFGFQAPAFYRKLGYTLEFVRESADPRLNKYFLKKAL